MCVGTQYLRMSTSTKGCFNAARGIMCVGTSYDIVGDDAFMFQCRTRHYVCRDQDSSLWRCVSQSFNAARGIMCVGTNHWQNHPYKIRLFQCRTRHYVCRDGEVWIIPKSIACFNAARGIMCVGTSAGKYPFLDKTFQCRTRHYVCRDNYIFRIPTWDGGFNAARGIMCVGTIFRKIFSIHKEVSMPHAALCVSGLCVPQPLSRAG